MTPRAPARPGMSVDTVETPALIVDLDVLDSNLNVMAEAARRAGVALRPHAKAHKCSAIARMQIERGAVGVCCQKTSEAEAMVAAGIRDVYVTNQVLAAPKLDRLAALARQARVALAADSAEGVTAAAAAARTAGVVLTVLVEIDMGEGRSGVPPGIPVAALAAQIAAAGSLNFGGLQAYRSVAQHAHDSASRTRLVAAAVSAVMESLVALQRAGIACPSVTGGGTGSFPLEAASGVFTEIQPGTYALLDARYAAHSAIEGAPARAFRQAMVLAATVTSAIAPGRAMTDAGTKAVEHGSAGQPVVASHPGVVQERADDEHGRLVWPAGVQGPRLGERLRLIPGNCDPTVNLHDWLVAVRGCRVEAVWPVDARGPGL